MLPTYATTILAVRKNGQVAMAGDGQVTLGQNMIMEHRRFDGFMKAVFLQDLPEPRLMPLLFLNSLKPNSRSCTAICCAPQWR